MAAPAINPVIIKELYQSTQQIFVTGNCDPIKALQINVKIAEIVRPLIRKTDPIEFAPNLNKSTKYFVKLLLFTGKEIANIYSLNQDTNIASQHAKQKRFQGIALDYLKLLDIAQQLPATSKATQFIAAIIRNDTIEVNSFMQQGIIPSCASQSSAGETLAFPVSMNISEIHDHGLGLAAAQGSLQVVKFFLDQNVNPNYFIQFSNPELPTECECGDNSCQQALILPPWLSAAISTKTSFDQKKIILPLLVAHGADPFVHDSEGKFWLTRIVRQTSFDPQLMHLLISTVDKDKAIRTTLEGARVSIIDDLLHEFDRIANKIAPQFNLPVAVKKELANLGLSIPTHALYSVNRSKMHFFPVPKEYFPLIRKWQESLLNNVTALIQEGVECSEQLAKNVESRLVLHKNAFQLDSSDSKAGRPYQLLQERNHMIRMMLSAAFANPWTPSILATATATAPKATSAGLPPTSATSTKDEIIVQHVMDYFA